MPYGSSMGMITCTSVAVRRVEKLSAISMTSWSRLRSPSVKLIKANGRRIITCTKMTVNSDTLNQITARIAQPTEGIPLSTTRMRSVIMPSSRAAHARRGQREPRTRLSSTDAMTRSVVTSACQPRAGSVAMATSRGEHRLRRRDHARRQVPGRPPPHCQRQQHRPIGDRTLRDGPGQIGGTHDQAGFRLLTCSRRCSGSNSRRLLRKTMTTIRAITA